MTGILVSGGEQPDYKFVKHFFTEEAYICAADSGLDYCLSNGIHPDYILGDMDSLADVACLDGFPDEMVERHSHEKDYTDTQLGLMHLKGIHCSPRILIGAGGGRLDHLLGVLSLFDKPDPPHIWISEKEEIIHIDSVYEGQGSVSEVLSFFPVGCSTCTMHSEGLKWPLDSLCWHKGDGGISNQLTHTEFKIEMKEGRLILIRALDRLFRYP
jgi:thiamine pyrophosphokinase